MNSDDRLLSNGIEPFTEALQTLKIYCGIILLSLARHSQEIRDKTISNFIARGTVCTENILSVWKEGSEADAWVLHRSLLDRLFHLHDLIERDSFLAFDEYSFLRIYETRHNLLCDKEMLNKFSASQIESFKRLMKSQKKRYQELKSEHDRWSRPKAENVARSMNLNFLYRFGYDYASMYVHPMAQEGENDLIRLTTPSRHHSYPDSTVVKNSLLVHSLLIQEGLNGSSVKWMAVIYDFIDHFREFLKDDRSRKFQQTFYKIDSAWPAVDFCKPRSDT